MKILKKGMQFENSSYNKGIPASFLFATNHVIVSEQVTNNTRGNVYMMSKV
jgi:hypothetical protein